MRKDKAFSHAKSTALLNESKSSRKVFGKQISLLFVKTILFSKAFLSNEVFETGTLS